MKCALSRLSCSLASAESTCWAKRNHGFSKCQHRDEIFSSPRQVRVTRRIDEGVSCNTTRTIFRASTSTHRSAENKQWQGLHRRDAILIRVDALLCLIGGRTRGQSKRCAAASRSRIGDVQRFGDAPEDLRRNARTIFRFDDTPVDASGASMPQPSAATAVGSGGFSCRADARGSG